MIARRPAAGAYGHTTRADIDVQDDAGRGQVVAQLIYPIAAVNGVAACSAIQYVVQIAAVQHIGPAMSDQRVVVTFAIKVVDAVGTIQRVIA